MVDFVCPWYAISNIIVRIVAEEDGGNTVNDSSIHKAMFPLLQLESHN